MIYDLGGDRVKDLGAAFIAPSSSVIGRVTLGEQSSIWFNTVVRGDVEAIHIGPKTNVQDGSVLHADAGVPLNIGSEVTVGHMVMAHGARIGDRVLLGIGSIILNGAEIGEESIVGAHALVTEGKVFPPRSLIVGAPAKAIRELTDDEVANLKWSAEHYVKNALRFAEELRAT